MSLSHTIHRFISFPEPATAALGLIFAIAIIYIICFSIAASSRKKYGVAYITVAVVGCYFLYIYLAPSCTEHIKPESAVLDQTCIRVLYNNSRIDIDCHDYLRLATYNDTHYTACNESCSTEITTRSEAPGVRYKIPAVICKEQCYVIEFLTEVNWLYNILIGIIVLTVCVLFASVA